MSKDDKLRQVVDADRWDLADYGDIQEPTRINDTINKLEEINWTAEKLVQDVWSGIFKERPRIHGQQEMHPAFQVNQKVMSEFADNDMWESLRHHTVGDSFGAGLAIKTMAPYLTELYEKLKEAQDTADTAQAASDALEDAEGNGAGENELEALTEALRAAEQELEQALDNSTGSIAKAVRQATTEAQEEAEQASAAATGWGLGPGEMARMNPDDRMRLADKLNTPKMRRISELFGRLRNDAWAVQTKTFEHGPDELHGIIPGDDLTRLVGSELLLLADDDLYPEFLDKYSRAQLLTFEMRRVIHEAKGSVIYLEDNSSSMGELERAWAKAVGLVLLDTARKQKRGFRAIVFSDGVPKEFDFGDDASTSTTEDMLEYASFVMTGGTNWQRPLDLAVQYLRGEHDRVGRTTGDIVLATDDACRVDDHWLSVFDKSRDELKFRLYGIGICTNPIALNKFCDYVTTVDQFTDGSEVKDIFRDVAKGK